MMNKFGKELGEYLEFINISIKEFAERIDTTPKNLIDIIKGNIELSQNMIYNISFVTGIPVSYIENVENNYKLDLRIKDFIDERNLTIRKFINLFKYKELRENYNVEFTDEMNDYWIAKDILKYLRITSPEVLYNKDSTIFYKSNNDKPELLALWLERCYRLSQEQTVGEYDKDNIEGLVRYIKEMAKKNIFDEDALIKMFNSKGIYLVIENDLSSSKIRGAFKVLKNKPAIYITRKHKRIADIYFALLHELAHCKKDFNRAKNGGIVSNIDVKENLDFEIAADNIAFNWMVDDKDYKRIKDNLSLIDKNEYIKSFVVYRLANDKVINYSSDIYQKYNIIVRD